MTMIALPCPAPGLQDARHKLQVHRDASSAFAAGALGRAGRSRTRPVRPVPAGMRAPTLPRAGETPACALPAGVEGVAEVAAGRACDERAMQHEKIFAKGLPKNF